MNPLIVRRLLPSLLRIYRSCVEVLVVLECKSLVSSRRLLLLGKLQCMLRLRCIFLDKIQMLYLSSNHLLVLHEERLDQEKYRSLRKAHSLYISAHQRLEELRLAFCFYFVIVCYLNDLQIS